MTTAQALRRLYRAQETLYLHLNTLEGPERREGIRQALNAGIGATELAKGLGISRARIYQLKEEA